MPATIDISSCHLFLQVFYGREDDLEKVRKYIVGPSAQPLILYGAGGCGKTSLLAKSASLINIWLSEQAQGIHFKYRLLLYIELYKLSILGFP